MLVISKCDSINLSRLFTHQVYDLSYILHAYSIPPSLKRNLGKTNKNAEVSRISITQIRSEADAPGKCMPLSYIYIHLCTGCGLASQMQMPSSD